MIFNKRKNNVLKSKIGQFKSGDEIINEVRNVLSKGKEENYGVRLAVENLFGYTFCLRSEDNYFAANAYCFFDTVFIIYFSSWIHAHKYIYKSPDEMKAFIQAYQTSMMMMFLDTSIFNISENIAKKIYDDRMRTYSSYVKDGIGLDNIISTYSRLVQFERENKDLCIPMLSVPLNFSYFNDEMKTINNYIERTVLEIIELVINRNATDIDYYN